MNFQSIKKKVLDFAVAHPNERDCWIKAPAMTAMLESGDAQLRAIAVDWLERVVASQRDSGNLSYADTVHALSAGHVRSFSPLASLTASLGYPLLLAHQQAPRDSFLEAAARQVQALRNAPRTRDGGVWARGEAPELWVDFTYLMGPFLALYGQLVKDPTATDDAFHQFLVHVDHLLEPRKHLARHAWCEQPDHFPQSTFWTRGNGWLVCAAVDLLRIAPDHHSAARVSDVLRRVLDAMAGYQERSGFFCHVLDDPRSNLESSGTVMFAYAQAQAVRLGIAPPTDLERARRAIHAVAETVEPSGKVPGVAVPPGGPGVPFDWTLFGQGFFALAVDAVAAAEGTSA